jgi:hypothetical protein
VKPLTCVAVYLFRLLQQWLPNLLSKRGLLCNGFQTYGL